MRFGAQSHAEGVFRRHAWLDCLRKTPSSGFGTMNLQFWAAETGWAGSLPASDGESTAASTEGWLPQHGSAIWNCRLQRAGSIGGRVNSLHGALLVRPGIWHRQRLAQRRLPPLLTSCRKVNPWRPASVAARANPLIGARPGQFGVVTPPGVARDSWMDEARPLAQDRVACSSWFTCLLQGQHV